MTNEKFIGEVQTLERFFTKFCHDKHTNIKTFPTKITYKNISYELDLELCDECYELINYSFDRLQECPHEEKPRCRQCPNQCYEKKQWKALAKLMRYSGFQFGLTKIRKLFKKGE